MSEDHSAPSASPSTSRPERGAEATNSGNATKPLVSHRNLNALLDRCDKLKEGITATRDACLEMIERPVFDELYHYFKLQSDHDGDEKEMEDVQKFVFRKIPYEKAEVVTKLYHLLYLEGEEDAVSKEISALLSAS
eukprot:jgi/Chlat1/299/Chrsp1S03179